MSNGTHDLSDEARQEIVDLISQGRNIQAMKRFCEVTGADLRTAKEAVEGLSGKPTDARATELSDELRQELADLVLEGNKIQAIKRLREAMDISLRDAKETVDRLSEKLGETHPNTEQAEAKGGGCLPVLVVLITVAILGALCCT